MASFLLRNPLNPGKVVSLGITYTQVIDVKDKTRELLWVVEIATNETTVSGVAISPEIIHLIDLDSMDAEIKEAVERISAKINWEPLSEDTRAPIIEEISPSTYTAAITSAVSFGLIDLQPSAGIDLSSIQLFINDIEVSPDMIIEGDEYGCNVSWRPRIIVYDTY
jgi:hypothetical protein